MIKALSEFVPVKVPKPGIMFISKEPRMDDIPKSIITAAPRYLKIFFADELLSINAPIPNIAAVT
ncbi:hypothetical protein SDC9_185858 [bioreactor metagenome]|uniref:Uncharacterized protein n=1 Tax=bioreactor metagenome TaxID=1076179 RepID=A0A645HQC9_9ZZZZ